MLNDMPKQRWIALGLFFLVLILVIFLAIVPAVSAALEYNEQKQELAFRLQRAKRIVDKKDSVLKNIASLEQQYQQQNYFNTRETVALASADLQKIVKSAISQAGGQLSSTQVLPSKSRNGLNKVVVKVRMVGDIEVVRSVMHEIETAVPLLVIDQFDARPVRGKRQRKTRKILPDNKININFQVTAYMRAADEQ